jgi:hypothetical protein
VLASAALDALGAEQRFSLAFRARGDALELRVNGRPVVQATDATLESGVIGLYAAGDGVGFAEVLASNLKGR